MSCNLNLSLILLFTLLFSLTACQPEREIIREVVYQPAAPTPKSENQWGVDDGGGGSGVKGKPLESYAIKISNSKGFQTHVKEIINALSIAAPNLAADFIYLVNERSWFSVPVSLDQISRAKLGVFFPTEQMAIQSSTEIWFNSQLFDSMDESAQGHLIVHELLMGVRILEQLDGLEKCLARSYLLHDKKSEYRQYRSECFKSYPKVGSGDILRFKVSQDDYSLIRKLTILLFSEEGFNDFDIETELRERNFRKY